MRNRKLTVMDREGQDIRLKALPHELFISLFFILRISVHPCYIPALSLHVAHANQGLSPGLNLEADVHGARRMRQRADADEINARFPIGPDIFKRDAAG